MVRALVLALPLLTVLAVSVLVFGFGAPRPIASARVWGGATDQLSHFSGWLELSAPPGPQELRLSGTSAGGARATTQLKSFRDERVEFTLDFPQAPGAFDLELWLGPRSLGHGRIALSHERWLSARRRGGFFTSRLPGELKLAVAPERGAFAVPFAGRLLLRVERGGTPVPAAVITLKSDGSALGAERLVTDARGLASTTLTPREHVVTLRASAQSPDGARGELFTNLPVVPGAMFAERRGDELVILGPGGRSHADVSLVSEAGRLFGARVALAPYSDGSRGALRLPALAPESVWAVVQSDAAAPSPAAVGWPLFEPRGAPASTFDAVDVLLLDTASQALGVERARRRGVQQLAAVVGLLGAAGSVSGLLAFTILGRRSGTSNLNRELGPQLTEGVMPAQSLRSLLAISLIVFGFFLLVALLAWRLA